MVRTNHSPFFPACKCSLKIAADGLCAFFCDKKVFKFVRVSHNGLQMSFEEINNISAPEYDLIEFDENSGQIYELWHKSQEFFVSNSMLDSKSGYDWSSRLQIGPKHEIKIDEYDPKKDYCKNIFRSELFQPEDIVRALS